MPKLVKHIGYTVTYVYREIAITGILSRYNGQWFIGIEEIPDPTKMYIVNNQLVIS